MPRTPAHATSQPPPTTTCKILVAICTAPKHREARAAIRESWGKALQQTHQQQQDAHFCALHGGGVACEVSIEFVVSFFVGMVGEIDTQRELLWENHLWADFVRPLWFEESYANLSKKTISMLAWAKEQGFDGLLKVDDDSYVHPQRLIKLIKTFKHREILNHAYAGVIHRQFPVLTNPHSKWFMSDQYAHETYPDYAAGPMYFVGKRILDELYFGANTTQQNKTGGLFPFRVEDAGLGIWIQQNQNLARKENGVVMVDVPALLYKLQCEDSDGNAVYINPVEPQEMQILHENGQRGDLCNKGKYTTLQCVHSPCLCDPSPPSCLQKKNDNDDNDDNDGNKNEDPNWERTKSAGGPSWTEFMNQGYQDVMMG